MRRIRQYREYPHQPCEACTELVELREIKSVEQPELLTLPPMDAETYHKTLDPFRKKALILSKYFFVATYGHFDVDGDDLALLLNILELSGDLERDLLNLRQSILHKNA